MIHVCHSATAQILRQRRRTAAGSAFLTLLALTSAAAAALFTPIFLPHDEHRTNLRGIYFQPIPDTSQAKPPKHQRKPDKTVHTLHLSNLVTFIIPDTEANQPPSYELELLESQPEESETLETDAEALLHRPHQDATPQAKQEVPRQETEDYIPPAYRSCPPPSFPPSLRLRRQEQIVGVLIEVDEEGIPREVSITHPSGSHTLDQHSRSWILRNWRFAPARLNGKPIEAKVSTELRYTLTN